MVKKVLLIKDGESLPIGEHAKKLRTTMLAEELVKRGYDVTWFASTFDHFSKTVISESDAVIQINNTFKLLLNDCGKYSKHLSLSRIGHHQKLGKALKEYLAKEGKQYDAIIAAHPLIETSYEAVKFAKANQIPVIVDIRDRWPDEFTDHLPVWLKPLVFLGTRRLNYKTKYAFKHATKLCSMSQYLLDWGSKKAKRSDEGEVFPLGSSLDKLDKSTFIMEAKEPKKQLNCVYVGGLIHSYDLTFALKASQIRDDYHFTIGGAGPWEGKWKQMANPKNVNFVGWLNTEQVAQVLLEADILLLPLGEKIASCMPNKLFDYLWAGKPILACGEGELTRLIQADELGYVYNLGKYDSFMQGLDYLKDEKVRAATSQNCLRVFDQRFRTQKIYQHYADFLEKLISGRKDANEKAV